jgi:IclR family KDG regulon transcriptional repressor
VNDLVDKARPLMQRIVDAVGESVNLARLEGTDCVYLAFVESPYGARRVVAVGERFPANASAVGKVLLAALDEDDLRRRLSGTRLRRFTQRTITDVEELIETLRTVRIRGYATSKEELLPGLYTVAMPIRDSSRQVVAAMSVSLPSARWNDHSARRTLRELQSAVYGLCRQLGSMEDLDTPSLEIADIEWQAELNASTAFDEATSPVGRDQVAAGERTSPD